MEQSSKKMDGFYRQRVKGDRRERPVNMGKENRVPAEYLPPKEGKSVVCRIK